jgi:hypothetical protein
MYKGYIYLGDLHRSIFIYGDTLLMGIRITSYNVYLNGVPIQNLRAS